MTDLRPVLLNARDAQGAGTASRRIHEGLRRIGVDSRLLVRRKSTSDPSIVGPRDRIGKAIARVRPLLDALPLRLHGDVPPFSLNWVPDRTPQRVADLDPDVVHLNWVAGGSMSISSLSEFDAPLVWRFPDMWPLTGGCHYSEGCDRYREACGECPKLNSDRKADLSRATLWRKKRALAGTDVTVVAPSSWLATHAQESALFGDSRIEVIPNGLNTDRFRPVDPAVGRSLFDLPQEAPLVLFGSVGPLADPRKGYELLRDALTEFSGAATDAELVVFGTSEPEDPPDFGRPTHYTGYLNDEESLALLYAAADIMAVPSRYEGFGQTVTEAMACGTPVVAFDATGPSDTVVHEETGYLAEPYDPMDFARGLSWVLADPERRRQLGDNARERAVQEYHLTDIAQEYLELYRDVIGP
jgi:glycosyltransferase involved in cell wall biosynthesis